VIEIIKYLCRDKYVLAINLVHEIKYQEGELTLGQLTLIPPQQFYLVE